MSLGSEKGLAGIQIEAQWWKEFLSKESHYKIWCLRLLWNEFSEWMMTPVRDGEMERGGPDLVGINGELDY